jgi:hypothetical protein
VKETPLQNNIYTNLKETPLQVQVSGQGQVMGRYEVGNEPSGCMKE